MANESTDGRLAGWLEDICGEGRLKKFVASRRRIKIQSNFHGKRGIINLTTMPGISQRSPRSAIAAADVEEVVE